MNFETAQPQDNASLAPAVGDATPDDGGQDAAFLSGFSVVRGGDDDAGAKAEVQAVENQNQDQQDPQQGQMTKAEAKAILAGYTEDQIKSLLEKAGQVDAIRHSHQKLAGQYGSALQQIQRLDAAIKSGAGAPQFSKEKLKKLSESFPELAEILADDLAGIFGAQKTETADPKGPTPDPLKEVSDQFSRQMAQKEETYQRKILTIMHPNWLEMVHEPEFSAFTSKLSQSEQELLNSGWDAEQIGAILTRYKQSKSTSQQSTVSSTPKKDRLSAAVVPKSGARAPSGDTEEDAFTKGFNSIRKH
ncbi:hypothetical protein [Caudoviricetes sp.]|nr:hypothetical protein [Caudoviricetes sp.]